MSMNDPFGFNIDAAPDNLPTQNLGAGTYELLVEEIIYAQKAKGSERVVLQAPVATPDFVIEVHCVLAKDAGGFAQGWKHTMFFRPFAENDIAQKISQKHLKDIVRACGIGEGQKWAPSQLCGKIIRVTLEVQKNNPEYTNIKKIESNGSVVMAAAATQPAPAAQTAVQPTAASNGAVPDWNA